MCYKNYFYLFFILLGSASYLYSARVALCVMATGKYDVYAENMIASARTYFLTNHDVHYFIFTDGTITDADDVTRVFQKRLGWPHDTLMRFAVYLKHKDLFDTYDYIFALDADMRFVAPVEEKILSTLVATQHPGYVNQRGTYESNKKSKAYVGSHEGQYYFAGGFYGGTRGAFFDMMQAVVANIESDLKYNYIAVWHDESHLNRYFIDHQPTKILSPAYCYPENANFAHYKAIQNIKKRIIAIDKNHSEARK